MGRRRLCGAARRRQPPRGLRAGQSAVARAACARSAVSGRQNHGGDARRGSVRHRRRVVPRRRATDGDAAVERPRQLAQRADVAARPVQDPGAGDHQHARRRRGVERRAGADGTRRAADLRRHRGPARDTRHAGFGCRGGARRRPYRVRHPPARCVPAAAAHHGSARMNRLDATRQLVAAAGDDPIVASLGHPAYDLYAAADRPASFYTWGSMGLASSIGLGLAMARPDLRVFVLDGDGSLLMNLGSLATIGLLQPPNLVLIVMDNEEYATTGGQATPTAHGADLEATARALRIVTTATVRSAEELQASIEARESGPRVIVAKVSESAPAAKPPLDCVFIKQRFMAAIA